MENSLLLKSGITRKLTSKDKNLEKAVSDVTIEFTNEKKGLAMARKFKRLAENPNVKLNIVFVKKEK